ncbi:MAG TPA: beta-propeller fold lactonase family protein [Gaiellaceae bacterium]|nr:beta-propeller fold lactonase family protein [Gaiellaceae bacterium]
MRAFRFSTLLVLAAAVAAVAAGGAAASPAGPHASRVVGHVYVNDNTAPANTVAGWDRHADGSLTPIAGSPFAVGGSGRGRADASQGSLQLSADGRYLLAVDAGSNQISVLRIKHDGKLQRVGHSPVSSGGVNPVSIAVHRNLVYVANAGPGAAAGDTNYTGFRLDGGGHLRPIPNSTYVLPNDSQPGQILFNRDGTRAAGTRIATSLIDSFVVGHDGRLTPAAGSPYDAQAFSPPQGFGQFGSEFSPTNADQLFVSDAHTAAGGAAFPGLVSSFTDASDGTLTPVGAPVANDGSAACWIEVSHDGRFLFDVNTASASISSYSIGAGGALTFLQSTGPGQIGGGAEDARLSPDGATLWVVEAGTNGVTGFTVDGGTLTPLAAADGPAGATPSGIVVT